MTFDWERGSVTIVAAAVLLLVVVLGLGVADVCRVLVGSSRAQTAADAAALAAAQELAFPSGLDPAQAAGEFAERNGASLTACECEVGSTEAIVTVELPVGPLFLAGSGRTARADARAVIEVGT